MIKITNKQLDYMENKLRDAIAANPDDILIWLDCYMFAVSLSTMIPSSMELGSEDEDAYIANIHWMKDHWPLDSGSEPETLKMIDIAV